MAFRPSILLLLPLVLLTSATAAQKPIAIPGLVDEVKVIRDQEGIPHILAHNEHDLVMMQGWVHARDRLFQMDFRRRQAGGTVAELLGVAALQSDVELRTLGLRRAAERSLAILSAETRAALNAYAEGVNLYVAGHPLPPEYGLLELTAFEPWTAVDSLAVAKLIAFGLSFDLDDIERTETLLTYQEAGALLGFDGTALFSEDTHRSAPFDPASTIPDASLVAAIAVDSQGVGAKDRSAASADETVPIRAEARTLGQGYLEKLGRLPYLRGAVRRDENGKGSNEWAVSGALTVSGRPLTANDQHLALDTPSTFYQNHLRAPDAGFDVIGGSFAGAPYVIVGHNKAIAWGATVHPMDVTDVFQEQVVPDPTSPSGLSTLYLGSPEPIIPIPQTFRVNVIGDGVPDSLIVVPPDGVNIPPAVLIVPRRNQGPIIALDPATGSALSVQYTGFSGTRETEAFRAWNLAAGLDDFVTGLQSFDVGSQNWAYADTAGNIAYFTSAEMPLREDLQAGFVAGRPPFFIRSGLGGNEWLPLATPQPRQAIPFEILPFEEMPQIVNPPAGYFVNANNDPAGLTLDNDPLNQPRPGGGIFYLNPGFDIGIRAGRITRLIRQKLADGGLLSAADMSEIQADVVLGDAEVFVPLIAQAFANATAPGALPLLAALAADPRVIEAVGRLEAWDRSTPTGVAEGYDASDVDGKRLPPSDEEIDNSVAATIYSVWRGQIVKNTIDGTLDAVGEALGLPESSFPKPDNRRAVSALRHLFDSFDTNQGVGASGLNFFNVPGVSDSVDRRDIIVLQSLAGALNLLAGPAFERAFGGSALQQDYRWGRLHRLVLDHPLGGPFSIPPAGGAFPPSFPDLPGLAVDGGFEVVDASRHSARADEDDEFMFGSGPTRRFVGEVRAAPRVVDAESSLPGGESGILGDSLYANLLGRWLTNDSYALRRRLGDFARTPLERVHFVPATTD